MAFGHGRVARGVTTAISKCHICRSHPAGLEADIRGFNDRHTQTEGACNPDLEMHCI
jgi:hypothetical protein